MSSIHFPYRPRTDDPHAAVVVQRNLDYLADRLLALGSEIDGGSSVVPGSATSVAVLFSVSLTNPNIVATPTTNPGPKSWWVGEITDSGFTFHVGTPADPGGLSFDWMAKGRG